MRRMYTERMTRPKPPLERERHYGILSLHSDESSMKVLFFVLSDSKQSVNMSPVLGVSRPQYTDSLCSRGTKKKIKKYWNSYIELPPLVTDGSILVQAGLWCPGAFHLSARMRTKSSPVGLNPTGEILYGQMAARREISVQQECFRAAVESVTIEPFGEHLTR